MALNNIPPREVVLGLSRVGHIRYNNAEVTAVKQEKTSDDDIYQSCLTPCSVEWP